MAAMCPKFLILHRFRSGQVLESDADLVMVNPRRLNGFWEERRSTQQPGIYCGTYLDFGRGECLIVRETVNEIKRALSK